jgi:hypothetical protein
MTVANQKFVVNKLIVLLISRKDYGTAYRVNKEKGGKKGKGE